MRIKIEKKYLYFPIKIGAEKCTVEIFCDGGKVIEFVVETGDQDRDFYAYYDVRSYYGKEIELRGQFYNGFEHNIIQSEVIPDRNYLEKVPRIHFTPHTGWMNDPNGLVYNNGKYHLFFQHNPIGVSWANMHWGHAESSDLLHWKQKDEALYPDQWGEAYSGSCIVDKKNVAGFGENALICYYTAAGGNSKWSTGGLHMQRQFVSCDNGNTFFKNSDIFLEHVKESNRDPKVFYHQETDGYIMVLFLEGNEFAIFRSEDLKKWAEVQRFSLEKAWECPDLFQLAVTNAREEKRWVFWTADGFYYTCEFDGYCISNFSERKEAYGTTLPYAAQTFENTGCRVVSQAWLRTKNQGHTHTGIMAIPVELSLVEKEDNVKIRLKPIQEIVTCRSNHTQFVNDANLLFHTTDHNSAYEFVGTFELTPETFIVIELFGEKVIIDLENHSIKIGDTYCSLLADKTLDIRIFIDFGVLEIFANDYTIYIPHEVDFASLTGVIKMTTTSVMHSVVDIYNLESLL